MWSYYGAKTNLVDLYPKPKHGLIIEPFAGSARYALKYFDRDVILIDKYPVIVKIWKWLQKCSPKDILGMPRFSRGDSLRDFKWNCEEECMFMGFIVGAGAERPRFTPTARKTIARPNHINFNLKRISEQLYKIKHWKIIEGDYNVSPEVEATWFIDPPYEFGGHSYVMSNKKINFLDLGDWCKRREGQIIVCENTKATWMNFKPIVKQRGSLFTTTEAIWSNYETVYDKEQLKLF